MPALSVLTFEGSQFWQWQLENDSAGVSDSTTADCDRTLNVGEEDPESLESGSASLMLNQVAVLKGRVIPRSHYTL